MSTHPEGAALSEDELLALTELVVLVALVDGQFSVKEYSALVERLCALEPALTADQVNLLIDRVDVPQRASPEFRQTRLDALARVLERPAARTRALEVAIHIASAHEGIGRRETAFLVRAAETLGFSSTEALALLKN